MNHDRAKTITLVTLLHDETFLLLSEVHDMKEQLIMPDPKVESDELVRFTLAVEARLRYIHRQCAHLGNIHAKVL